MLFEKVKAFDAITQTPSGFVVSQQILSAALTPEVIP